MGVGALPHLYKAGDVVLPKPTEAVDVDGAVFVPLLKLGLPEVIVLIVGKHATMLRGPTGHARSACCRKAVNAKVIGGNKRFRGSSKPVSRGEGKPVITELIRECDGAST